MTNQEKVELLKEKAGVSYAEAEQALEQANWDLLDAVLVLEQADKARTEGGSYSTKPEEEAPEPNERHAGVRDAVRWSKQALKKLLRIGNTNHFVVTRKGEELFSLPVTVLAILLICAFWLVTIALVVGLFCGVRYSFEGPNLGKQTINNAMDRAAEVAESVKEDLVREHGERPDSEEKED